MSRQFTLLCYSFAMLLISMSHVQPVLAQEPVPKTLSELKARLALEMQRQHIAGMMLAIVDHDSTLFSGGLGYSDMSLKTPVTEKHLFRGASITKMFVALGILNLVKEGKLHLDTKLRNIAPEISFENKWEASRPVTIDKLMEHTTGFSDKSPFEEYNFTGRPYAGIQGVKMFTDFMVSKWEPGQRHSYSSVNYAVLDYIIEKVSGKPIGEYLQEKVFTPLQMPHANVVLAGDNSGKYSKGYVWKVDHFQLVPHQPAFNAGYSSLNISATDFAQALKAYLNSWKTSSGEFLSEAILNETETPHTYLSARAGLQSTYGYGNESSELAGRIFRGHRGAIGGFLSAFLYSRNLRSGYAFAINTHNESFYQYADHLISQFVLQRAPNPPAVATYPVKSEVVKPFLGYYRLRNPNQLYTGFFESLTNTIKVKPIGNELSIQILGRGSLVWQAIDQTGLRYKNQRATNAQVLFLRDSENNPVILDGTLYFEKTTAIAAWTTILSFAISVLLSLSTFVFVLANLILFLAKKIPHSQLLARSSPTFIAIGLFLIILSISQLFDHMKEATPTGSLFIIWFIGKYVFALGALLMPILLGLKWKSFDGNGLKIYLLSIVISSCYLFFILISNSWYYLIGRCYL